MITDALDRILTGATSIYDVSNGFGRGDGYDAQAWRLRTGRYLGRYSRVNGPWHYVIADTQNGVMRAIDANGHTPGCAPGSYRPIEKLDRIAEAKGGA